MGRTIRSIRVVSSTNNIPIAFDATAGSKAMTGLGTAVYAHVMIINESTTALSVVMNGDPVTPPSATSTARAFVLASSTAAFDDISIGDAIYLQSEASAITSGTVTIMVW